MRKPELNLSIDLLIFFAFIMLASTGLLIYFILPAGHGHLTIWGMNRHGWGDIHFWIAIVFFWLVAIHLYLHWSWITTMMPGKRSKASSARIKTVGIITITVMIVLLAAAPFLSPVDDTGAGEQNKGQRIEMHP